MKFNCKKLLSGVLSAMMLCTLVPFSDNISVTMDSYVEAAESNSTVIYSTGFEDGVNDFTGRDGFGTFNVTDSDSYEGSKCLMCTDRTKSWHGPQIALDNMIEPGVEYIVSAWVKTPWYNSVKLSMEYTNSSGERKFFNLNSANSENNWAEISETKFSIPKNVTNAYIYFECNDTADIYLDNFEIKTAPVYSIQEDIASLKDVFSNQFKIGGAVTTSELAVESAQDLVKKHYNSITPGNELKPDALLDQSATIASGSNVDPVINVSGAKEILDFCTENNIPVRGHVLVWHSQTPDWFFKEGFQNSGDWVSKEIMLQRMENYIKNVFKALAEEYPDVNFYAWDVVNEAWLDDGTARKPGEQGSNGSNNSAWVQIFGDNSFIKYAFEYARKYAPEGCKLYYNDFNEYMPSKTSAIVEMAEELKAEGLIDGIGMQSHLDVTFPGVSAYKKALDAFSKTGLDIQITELDATTSDLSEAGFEAQATYYKSIMEACVEYSDYISSVVFWGTTDDKSWRADRCPLLFNEDFTAKPAYYSIISIDGLDVEPTEPSTEEPTTETTVSPDYILGDVNLDGIINVNDIIEMQKYLLKISDVESVFIDNSDLNFDDKVNIFDLIALKRMILENNI